MKGQKKLPPWDERFYLVDSKRNERVNPDFKPGNEKVYKTIKKPVKRMNFVGELENEFRLPTYSKAFKPSNIIGELEWKPNLTTFSKNNGSLPRSFREYFGEPVDYDVRGMLQYVNSFSNHL